MFWLSKCAFAKAMSVDGGVNGDNGAWVYSSRMFHVISRRSRDARDILRSPTSV